MPLGISIVAGSLAQHWEAPGSNILFSLKAFKPTVFIMICILQPPGLRVAKAELGSDGKADLEQEEKKPEGIGGRVEENLDYDHAEEGELRGSLPFCEQVLSSH